MTTQKKPILSVCIPTYKRPEFIIKGLKFWKEIIKKNQALVELVVINDFSEDDTDTKIREFIKKNPKLNIVYRNLKKRLGFDKMILSIMQHAHGDYCWLISDDDLPSPNSLKKIFRIIKKYPESTLIHVNYSRFDNKLQKITAKRMVGDIKKDVYFTDKDEFFFKEIGNSYFRYLGTNVITMSSDIVNRQKWLAALPGMEKFIGHNFMHCFVIAKMISKDTKIFFNAAPVVQYLSNNHRVWPNDIWKDYNNVFLNYLRSLGFSKKKIQEMKEAQKKYEKREEVLKNPIVRFIYNFTQPIHSKIDYVLSKFDI